MGNNSIVIILLIACGLYPQRIWAQQYMEVNYGQANVNTVAPTSASMIKFIDHPVSTFTGTPAISHTLFTLRDNQIEIPITLSYCASGIKVSEEASWVGMGWNLSVGGLVVQNVVGDLDRTSEWQNTRNSLLNRLQQVHTINGYSGISYQGQDMNNYDTFYNNAVQGKYQPDVFYYSYPGGSGKFCLDIRNDSICVLDRSHGDIIKMYERETDNQSPSEWIVTAPDGTLHNFTYACRDIADCNPLQITGRTWSLTSSYLPNGQIVDYYYAETIHNAFQYKTHIDIFSDPNSQYYRRWNDGNCPSDATYHTRTVKQVHEILLDSIATDNYVIIFQKSDRADYQNGQRLDDIFIRSRSGDCFRHFHFDYRYVESMTSDIGWMNVINHYGLPYPAECAGSRLFLESVCEVDSLGNCSDRLSFEYNEPERLPYKTSYAVDYWGYYNGILSNQTLIPDLTNLFAGNGQYNDLFMASFPTANRCCDTIAVTTGMLKSILYPTGGKTVYDYESNTYEANIFSRITSQGTQTSQEPTVVSETMIKDNNGSCSLPSSVRMFVDNGQSIILSATLSRGLLSWDELNDAAIVLVTDAPVVKRDTFNISDETVPFVTQQISFKATYPIWVTAYVSLPDAVGDQSLAMSGHASIEGVVRIIETPTTSNEQTTTEPFSGYNYGGGVRVREISHYESEETTTPTLREIYRYEGGKLNVPIDFCRKFVNQKYAIMKIMDYTGEIFTYDYTFTEIEGNLIPTIIVDMTNDIHIDWKEAYCQVSTIVCDNVYCSPYAFNASEVSYDRCTVYMDGTGRSLGRKVYEYYNNESTIKVALKN